MYINEVSKKCSLTKKAIDYYEKQGLVHPKIEKNGYRNYSNEDISLLNEIAVLRKLGLGVQEIKKIIVSSNKSSALSKYKYLVDIRMQKIIEQKNCFDRLIENYNINEMKDYVSRYLDYSFTIKEKLVQSFPSVYGMYLSIHFGQFLNEKIDSTEKKEAYAEIVHFLDHLNIPNELEEYLESAIPLIEPDDIKKMSTSMQNTMDESFFKTQQHSIESYIKFRNSEKFKATPVYKMQQLLVEFQQSNGYHEIFIKNLKILSNSYREYCNRLQEANKMFIEKFPQAEEFYQK